MGIEEDGLQTIWEAIDHLDAEGLWDQGLEDLPEAVAALYLPAGLVPCGKVEATVRARTEVYEAVVGGPHEVGAHHYYREAKA